MAPDGVVLRDPHERDLAAINHIYNEAVRDTTASFDLDPMPLDERLAWFSKFDADNPLVVAEAEGAVAGYAYYHLFRPRPGYRFTRETSVYVASAFAGRGIATGLYAELIARAKRNGVHSLVAVIGGENPASVALHKRFRFVQVGRIREAGRKFDRWHDMNLWQLELKG